MSNTFDILDIQCLIIFEGEPLVPSGTFFQLLQVAYSRWSLIVSPSSTFQVWSYLAFYVQPGVATYSIWASTFYKYLHRSLAFIMQHPWLTPCRIHQYSPIQEKGEKGHTFALKLHWCNFVGGCSDQIRCRRQCQSEKAAERLSVNLIQYSASAEKIGCFRY